MRHAIPTQDSDPARIRQVHSILVSIPSLIFLLSAFVPLSRQLTSNDIDWPILLDDLRGHEVAFGRDIVFTFGPWGFVWGAASATTLLVACAVWAILAFVVWWTLFRFVRATFPQSPLRAGVVLLAVSLPLGGDYVVAPDVRLLLFSFLLVFYHFFFEPRANDRSKLLLTCAVAFAGMIKFTCFVAGAAAIGIVTVDQLLQRKRRPVPLLAWLGMTLLAWLGAGQNPLDLPAYLRYSLSMTAGYADVMSLQSTDESRQILEFFVPAIWLLALLTPLSVRALHRKAWLLLSGMIILLLITFRCGYVRHDLHELTSTMLLLDVIAVGYLATATRFRNRREPIAWGLCLVVAGLSASQSLTDWHDSSLPREMGRAFRNIGDEAIELTGLARGEPSMVIVQRRQQIESFKARDPLPEIQSTADLFPRLSIALLSHGIPYNPRPTLQSYAAVTPALTALNASHLTGPNPPQHLFISTTPTSEHLPTLLDNRSWPEILSRYELAEVAGTYLHLARRPRRRVATWDIITEATVALGERYELPTDPLLPESLLWAQVEVQRSAFGAVMAQLYKPPPLSISMMSADGRSQRWRFVPSLGADGFLVGPLPTDAQAFAAVLSDHFDPTTLALRLPRSIAIAVAGDPHGDWHYQNQVVIRLFSVHFQPPPSPP